MEHEQCPVTRGHCLCSTHPHSIGKAHSLHDGKGLQRKEDATLQIAGNMNLSQPASIKRMDRKAKITNGLGTACITHYK